MLQAADGREALRILEQHAPIDLLLTDAIMPANGGQELAKRVNSLEPATKITYVGPHRRCSRILWFNRAGHGVYSEAVYPDNLGGENASGIVPCGQEREPSLIRGIMLPKRQIFGKN